MKSCFCFREVGRCFLLFFSIFLKVVAFLDRGLLLQDLKVFWLIRVIFIFGFEVISQGRSYPSELLHLSWERKDF